MNELKQLSIIEPVAGEAIGLHKEVICNDKASILAGDQRVQEMPRERKYGCS